MNHETENLLRTILQMLKYGLPVLIVTALVFLILMAIIVIAAVIA